MKTTRKGIEMTSDEMTIAVIEGMLDLIDEASLTYPDRFTTFKNLLRELSKTYYKGSEKEKEESSVYLVFPDFNLESNKPIPVVDGKVIIKDEVLNDILSFTREGYIKEEEYKNKINGILVSLNRALNGQ